jgi:hypothetical protein
MLGYTLYTNINTYIIQPIGQEVQGFGILELLGMDALTVLEKLTHATKQNPHPVMPLSEVAPDLPSMLRRAAIHMELLRDVL